MANEATDLAQAWRPLVDRYLFDFEDYDETLSADAERLMVSDDESCIGLLELGAPLRTLNTYTELREYLETSKHFVGTRIILIPQRTSVGRLAISQNGLRALVSCLHASPFFLDLAQLFGQKNDDDANSVPCYRSFSPPNGSLQERCFALKHTEQHGRPNEFDSWSVRKMGFYLSSNATAGQNTIIVINPSSRFEERLTALWKPDTYACEVLTLLLATGCRKWPQYLDHLERLINKMNSKVTTASVRPGSDTQDEAYEVIPSDSQYIHQLRHKLAVATRALSVDIAILEKLGREEPTSNRQDLVLTTSNLPPSDSTLQHLLDSLTWELKRSEWLITYVNRLFTLVPTILDFKTTVAMQTNNEKATEMTAAMKINGEKATEMTILARQDNVLMLQLTKKARKDSRTLKAITVLTLLYLPASFVSTLLGMGYIHIGRGQPVPLEVKGEFVIFVVLTLIFLGITIGAWLWFERQHREEDTDGVDEKSGNIA